MSARLIQPRLTAWNKIQTTTISCMTRGINGSRMLVKDEVFFSKLMGRVVMNRIIAFRIISGPALISYTLYKIGSVKPWNIRLHFKLWRHYVKRFEMIQDFSRFYQIQDDFISMNFPFLIFFSFMNHYSWLITNDIIVQ